MWDSRHLATWSRRPLVVAVVVVLVVSGIFGGWYWLARAKSSPAAVRDDGPTFYQALASLNSSVANQSGGPWSIFSVMGIAAQGPYSPSVKGYVSFYASVPVNGCQAALNGLTMFNGSIPIFTGTFNSGTAPFWQFAYYSNVTAEVLVGTNVLGVPHLFSPFPLQSNCTHAWGDFGLDPTYWTSQIYSNASLPPNSPLAARVDWGHVDTGYLDRHQPLVELFTSGPAMLASTQDLPYGRLGVDFVACGLVGVAGYGLIYYSGVNKNGSYPGGPGFNASENCAVGNSGTISGTYQVLFSNVTASSAANSTWTDASTTVDFALNGGGEYHNMWGLANWMASFYLTSSWGAPLPAGSSGCPTWVPSVTDCLANSSGWYVVLLSEGGEWLDSYGATANGTGWSVPVTAMVSFQQLVIVFPSSWSPSEDVFSVASTVSVYSIEGSFTT